MVKAQYGIFECFLGGKVSDMIQLYLSSAT